VPIRKFPEIEVKDLAGGGEARVVDLKPTNLDDVLTAAGPREANSPLRTSIPCPTISLYLSFPHQFLWSTRKL
jgi:hypothetical protein